MAPRFQELGHRELRGAVHAEGYVSNARPDAEFLGSDWQIKGLRAWLSLARNRHETRLRITTSVNIHDAKLIRFKIRPSRIGPQKPLLSVRLMHFSGRQPMPNRRLRTRPKR